MGEGGSEIRSASLMTKKNIPSEGVSEKEEKEKKKTGKSPVSSGPRRLKKGNLGRVFSRGAVGITRKTREERAVPDRQRSAGR